MGPKVLNALKSKPAMFIYGALATVAGNVVKNKFFNKKEEETATDTKEGENQSEETKTA